MDPRIIYTITDEAPALATVSLLPIIRTFTTGAGIAVETRDISLAGRILAVFPEYLKAEQRVSNDLAELGKLVQQPDANVIKLPNISASIPQLTTAIRELQEKGNNLPDYPIEPKTSEEVEIRRRYDGVKGSAVNPVLREGNSDRRAARSVKEYAKKHPHTMGEWSADSKSHVAAMSDGDYYGSDKSMTLSADTTYRIEHVSPNGSVTVLKGDAPLVEGEIIDAAVISKAALRAFLAEEIRDAKENGVLFSVHLKATMMKVSDPIIFGHVVSVFFTDLFEKYAGTFDRLNINANNGLRDLIEKIPALPEAERAAIESDLEAGFAAGPEVAMVDSDRGITGFHVPSDFIIDAVMPAAIRDSGRMWAPDGTLRDTKFVIPDRAYAGVYDATIEFCKTNGAFDPATMGAVSNVGLMAKKAEEYGSHDKTFEMAEKGTVRVVDGNGKVLLEKSVEAGDIFRMCQVKVVAVRDWVKLAVSRARISGLPAIFWLDEARAHDAQLIAKVKMYLKDHDTSGLEIDIMAPAVATTYTLERSRAGKDTISVTGNVLRDYLTDLFPILELGTSAKMLSIVELLGGGGLFETGAGGSAPKHVQQFVKEGHLRWDSLGEYLALGVSLDQLAKSFDIPSARVLAETVDAATGRLLENGKSPKRKVGEMDNRGGHYYFARYWAEALAEQKSDPALSERFAPLAEALVVNEAAILAELDAAQGAPVDLGGYYRPDAAKTEAAMCPSATLNRILSETR